MDRVIVGHVLKFPALIALVHVSSTGNSAAAWRYFTVWLIKGRLYALFARSFIHSFLVLLFVDTVYNFAPHDLHPWRMGGLVVVIMNVPGS